MLKKKSKQVVAVLMVAVMLVAFAGMAVSAATYTITPHTLASGATNIYYQGLGHPIAEGSYLSATFIFDREYQYRLGYQNVTTESKYTASSGTRSTASFTAAMPVTALYYVWLNNRASVMMSVTGGSVTC